MTMRGIYGTGQLRIIAVWVAMVLLIPGLVLSGHGFEHEGERDDEHDRDRQRDRTSLPHGNTNILRPYDGPQPGGEMFLQSVVLTVRRKCVEYHLDCGKHGVCALDHSGHPACVCEEDSKYVYGGRTCNKKGELLPVPSEYIIGLCSGVIVFLLIALIFIVADSYFNCRRRGGAQENREEEDSDGATPRQPASTTPIPPYEQPDTAPPYEEFEMYRTRATPTPPYEETPGDGEGVHLDASDARPSASAASSNDDAADALGRSYDDAGYASERTLESCLSEDAVPLHLDESQQSNSASNRLSSCHQDASASGTVTSPSSSQMTTNDVTLASCPTLDNFPKRIGVHQPLHFKKPFTLPRINIHGLETTEDAGIACEDTLNELSDCYNNRASTQRRTPDDVTGGRYTAEAYIPQHRTYRVLLMGSLGPEPVFLYEPWRSADEAELTAASETQSSPSESVSPYPNTEPAPPLSARYGYCTDFDLRRYVTTLLNQGQDPGPDADYPDSLSDSSGDTVVARSTKSDYSLDTSWSSDTTITYRELTDTDSDSESGSKTGTVVNKAGAEELQPSVQRSSCHLRPPSTQRPLRTEEPSRISILLAQCTDTNMSEVKETDRTGTVHAGPSSTKAASQRDGVEARGRVEARASGNRTVKKPLSPAPPDRSLGCGQDGRENKCDQGIMVNGHGLVSVESAQSEHQTDAGSDPATSTMDRVNPLAHAAPGTGIRSTDSHVHKWVQSNTNVSFLFKCDPNTPVCGGCSDISGVCLETCLRKRQRVHQESSSRNSSASEHTRRASTSVKDSVKESHTSAHLLTESSKIPSDNTLQKQVPRVHESKSTPVPPGPMTLGDSDPKTIQSSGSMSRLNTSSGAHYRGQKTTEMEEKHSTRAQRGGATLQAEENSEIREKLCKHMVEGIGNQCVIETFKSKVKHSTRPRQDDENELGKESQETRESVSFSARNSSERSCTYAKRLENTVTRLDEGSTHQCATDTPQSVHGRSTPQREGQNTPPPKILEHKGSARPLAGHVRTTGQDRQAKATSQEHKMPDTVSDKGPEGLCQTECTDTLTADSTSSYICQRL